MAAVFGIFFEWTLTSEILLDLTPPPPESRSVTMSKSRKSTRQASKKPPRAASSYEKWLAKAVHDFNRSERYKEIQEAHQIEQQELELVREMRQWL